MTLGAGFAILFGLTVAWLRLAFRSDSWFTIGGLAFGLWCIALGVAVIVFGSYFGIPIQKIFFAL